MNTANLNSPGLSEKNMLTKVLLICGIISSLYYIAINVYVPMQWEEYSISSQTPSELSAINAPTRQMWIWMASLYVLFFAAFGWGVLRSAEKNRHLHVVGVLILVYCSINIYWPPMHLRGNEPTITDTLHIVWAMMALLFMMLFMGFGAAALGKTFRIYTFVSWLLFILFGVLTMLDAPRIGENLPTPMIGVWERLNIGIFMLWVIVLAIVLYKNESTKLISKQPESRIK